MNVIAANLNTIILAWLVSSAILFPLLILAVRLAVVPMIDALTRARSHARPAIPDEERLIRIERALERLARDLERSTAHHAADAS